MGEGGRFNAGALHGRGEFGLRVTPQEEEEEEEKEGQGRGPEGEVRHGQATQSRCTGRPILE